MSLSPPWNPGNLFVAWWQIIEQYTKRDLTYARNRLPALAGLASRAASTWSAAYLAGVWKEHLWFFLLWETGNNLDAIRQTRYYAPSWSWASATSTISWHAFSQRIIVQAFPDAIPYGYLADKTSIIQAITIKHAECTYFESGPFMPPMQGYISVDGHIVDVSVSEFKKNKGSLIHYDVQDEGINGLNDSLLIVAEESEDTGLRKQGIVIRPCSEDSSVFERVGYWHYGRQWEENGFVETALSNIKLV